MRKLTDNEIGLIIIELSDRLKDLRRANEISALLDFMQVVHEARDGESIMDVQHDADALRDVIGEEAHALVSNLIIAATD